MCLVVVVVLVLVVLVVLVVLMVRVLLLVRCAVSGEREPHLVYHVAIHV